MKIDLNYYPGWTRKSITFTIDDGVLRLDKIFLDIVAPAGLKGTFNLMSPLNKGTPEEYRALYRGYEIANHCKYHPQAFTPASARVIKQQPFDEQTADRGYGYLTEVPGLYRIHTHAWTYMADDERYLQCVGDCQRDLEEVFGEGNVRGFVWPYARQRNTRVVQAVRALGFHSVRRTGCVEDRTGFALPADRLDWSYNADRDDMTWLGEKYEAFPDDGELKFFCFGVHSRDFDCVQRWDVLIDFCERYGNRPEDFWYAAVGEIFDYADAVRGVQVSDTELYNPSDVDLYIKIDGKRQILGAHERLALTK